MALIKEKTLDNGVIVNYHRVVSVNTITNNSTIIEVASYTSKEKREEEINYYENPTQEGINVFIETTYYNIDYDKNMNVNKAYEYLKTLEEFSSSTND